MQYNLPVLPDVPDYPQSAISNCGITGSCFHCEGCCTYLFIKNIPSVIGIADSEPMNKMPGETCPQAIHNTRGQLFCALHGHPEKPEVCRNWRGNDLRTPGSDVTKYQSLVHTIATLFFSPCADNMPARIGEDYRNGRLPPEVPAAIRAQCETAISIDPSVGRVYVTGILKQLLVTDVPEPFPWALLDATDIQSIIAAIPELPGADNWKNELRKIGINQESNPLHREFCQRYGLCAAGA